MKKRIAAWLSLLLLVSSFSVNTAAFANEKPKPDSKAGHWASASLERWKAAGIIQGDAKGNLLPNRNITVVEFAVMMNRLFGFQNDTGATQPSNANDPWYAQDLSLALKEGYLNSPQEEKAAALVKTELTRGEAARSLNRLFSLDSEDQNGQDAFRDLSLLDQETKRAIAAFSSAGYIQGYPDGSFKPERTITRGEMAVILDRMLALHISESGYRSLGNPSGNVLVNQPDAELSQLTVSNNLYLTEGTGKGTGSVKLDGVQVQGTLFVRSGVKSVELKNGSVQRLVVLPAPDGTASGPVPELTISGEVAELVLLGPAKVNAESVAKLGSVMVSEKAGNSSIQGSGTISALKIEAQNVTVNGKSYGKGDYANVNLGASSQAPVTTPGSSSGSGSAGGGNNGGNPGAKDPWSLVWSDEFNGTELDRSKWTFDLGNGHAVGNPGWGNNELEYYTDRSENVKVDSGNLVITAKKETYEGYAYTSARIKTKGLFSKKYGKFEIRAKAPTGQGLWPAIWMMPEDDVYGIWAASGELDIMEAWGSKPHKVAGTIHYGAQWPGEASSGKEYEFPNGGTIADYHTYAIEWEPGEIRWYVDGQLSSTKNDWYSRSTGKTQDNAYPAPFDQKFHLLMNLAVGGNFDGDPADTSIFPKSMLVDYVRVYELTGRPYRDPVPPTYEKEEYLPGAKLPQWDGNLVYNNGFTENVDGDPGMGIPNTAHWALYKDPGATASAAIEEIDGKNYAKVSITNAGGNSYSVQPQAIVSLAKGRYYKLTFSAKTDTKRSIDVRLTGGQSRDFERYSPSYTALLTNKMKDTYQMSFLMKSNSDNAARIEFNMGIDNHPVWIGNVRLVEVDGIVDPPADDIVYYPLVNGDFSDGLNGWETISDSGGYATSEIVNGEAKVTVGNQGTKPWSAMLIQNGLPITAGQTYVVSFDARSSVNRKMEIIAENGVFYRHFDKTIDLTTVKAHHSFEFTPADNDVVNLKFLLGILTDTTAVGAEHDIFIDNVVFEIQDGPVAKSPELLKDTTDNRLGKDIELTFIDHAAWRAKISAVKIGSTTLKASDYTVTAGKVTIGASNFKAEGSYVIRVEADGYTPASVAQVILANDGNIVVNGSFSGGKDGWSHYVLIPDAHSTLEVEGGVAELDIAYKGRANWHTQLYQDGIKLEAGKTYELSFKAWSTQDRPIVVEYTNTSIPAVTFHLTNNADTIHKNTFTVGTAGTLKLNYLLGDVTDGSWATPASEHTIYIDDVVIREATVSPPDTQAPSVPDGLSVQSKTSTSVTLSWQASTDNVGVTGYDVYQDNVLIGSTVLPSKLISGLKPNTAYSFTVKAKDAAGNSSAASAPLSVTTEAGGGSEPLPEQPQMGSGSYTTVLPAGLNQIQSKIYKTDNVTEKMQTNDWWSNLAWNQYSEAQYPHPLAMKNQSDGMRIYYPGNRITGNTACICGWMNDIHDFVVGHSNQATFPDAKVDGFSDWFVSALYQNGDNSIKATYGHGSPFVYFTYEGGDPKISFYDTPTVWSGNANSSVLGITIAGAHYALFGPTGSTWSGIGTKVLTNNIGSNDYFSIAVLPDNKAETLSKFKQYAYSYVTDTKVSWSYNESASEMMTTYTYSTEAKEGTQTGTIFSLYPHQWKATNKALLGYTYNSVRGLMKTAEGSSFQTNMKFTGVLPTLPDLGTYNRTKLAAYVDEAEAEVYNGDQDTYWIGKRLGKLATLAPIADQVGDTVAAEKFRNEIKTRLQDWFSATNSSGELKSENLFYYDSNWGTLFGYPDSYGSVQELNDHHFHYGYFIKAAAEIARVDQDWASEQNWGAMVNLLIRDTANGDRDDEMFPFLRNFDPYAGHSWASGHAKFGDGNNNESSSEEMNAWAGMILWGEATGDTEIRDLGIYQYTTAMNAINNYWFDVNGENFNPNFTRSTASMVWGGKTVGDGVWWTGNPEEVHGINWLPITGASLYLTHYPTYTNKNYLKMVEENGGTSFDVWEDLIYMYRAISNVDDAKAKFSARVSAMSPEAGNSKANAYHWIYNLDAIGNADPTVTANYPIYAVFNKDGVKTYLVYNMTNQEMTVNFSDGHTVTVGANSFNIGNGEGPGIVDTEAPTVPENLISAAKTSLTVTLSWSASTDNVGVTAYDIYVDGVLKGSTAETAYKVNGLTPDTAYTFTVKARDEAGNLSPASQGVTVTTDKAGEVPEVPELEGPVTLYLVGDSVTKELSNKPGTKAGEVVIPTAAPGDHSSAPANEITYMMNNVHAKYEGAGVTGYQFYFDTVEATVGTAVLVRISYDFDGDGTWDRMEKSPTYALNPIQNEWEKFTNVDRGSVTVTGSEYQNFNGGKIRVELWNQFGAGATKVKVNAAADHSVIMFPYSFSSGDVGGGPTNDTTAPTVPMNLAASEVTSTSVTLTWTASTDNVGVVGYEVYVDGTLKDTTSVTSLVINGLTANTTYDFTVKAKDAAGNLSAASAAITVTTPPSDDAPPLTGPMTLYLIGDDTTLGLSQAPGNSASEAIIPSAEGGDYYIDPNNPITYTLNNIHAAYKGTDSTGYQFYLDSVEAISGTVVMVRISYDFDGDGIWDRTEQSPTFALNDLMGWELFTHTNRGNITAAGGNYQDFSNGAIKIELWNQLGSVDTKVKVNAPSEFSQIIFPYEFE